MHKLTASLARLGQHDDGMITAEYAVGTVAACGFGGILYEVLTSGSVLAQIAQLVARALASIFS